MRQSPPTYRRSAYDLWGADTVCFFLSAFEFRFPIIDPKHGEFNLSQLRVGRAAHGTQHSVAQVLESLEVFDVVKERN